MQKHAAQSAKAIGAPQIVCFFIGFPPLRRKNPGARKAFRAANINNCVGYGAHKLDRYRLSLLGDLLLPEGLLPDGLDRRVPA